MSGNNNSELTMKDEKGDGRKWWDTNGDNSKREKEINKDQYESINSGFKKIICNDKLSNNSVMIFRKEVNKIKMTIVDLVNI